MMGSFGVYRNTVELKCVTFLVSLLIKVSASELLASNGHAAVGAVPHEYGSLHWSDHKTGVLAVVNHNLHAELIILSQMKEEEDIWKQS